MEHILIKNIGINKLVGAIFFVIISYIVFLRNIKFITKLNSIIVPILVLFIITIGAKNILDLNTLNMISITKSNDYSWIIQAIIYSSYNLILLIPVLINLKKYLKNKKQIMTISIITGVFISIIYILTFLLLINIDVNIVTLDMPIIYVINKKFKFISKIYGIAIIIAIFTTAISVGISFLNNICKDRKKFSKLTVVLCVSSVLVSQISFSKLVEILFPVFGYLGLVQIYFIFSHSFKK